MLWTLPLALGGMALGAVRGNAQARRQQEIEDDSRKRLAAQQKYSPWTGRTNFSEIKYAGATPFDATLGGGLQGGITGASLGQGVDAASAAAPSAASSSASNGSFLGGKSMAADLGKSSFSPAMSSAPALNAAAPAAGTSFLGGAGMSQSLEQQNPYLQQAPQAPSLYKTSPWPLMSSRGGY